MKRIAKLLSATIIATGTTAWAGDQTGASFLKITPSVKGESLGGMNPAASNGAQAMGVNPANLSDTPDNYEFTTGFATMIGGSEYGTAGLAVKREGGLSVGGSLTFLQSGPLEGRDANGALTSDFQSRDMAAGITVGTGGEDFRVGATVKGVREEIGQYKSNTVPAGDVGMSLKMGGIRWGAAALNLGSGIEFRGEKAGFPTIYSLGASIPLGGGMTGLAGAAQIAGETTVSLGMEYRLSPISLRLGYRTEGGSNLASKSQKAGNQALGGLTGGIGVGMNNWRLDYAVSQTAVEYGMGHRAAVTFRWGGEGAVERRPARVARPAAARPPAMKNSAVTTGSHRAYDPAPLKTPPRRKKTWVE